MYMYEKGRAIFMNFNSCKLSKVNEGIREKETLTNRERKENEQDF